MSAAIMLLIIACVVALFGFGLAAVIWTSHPVRWTSVECGTLSNPVSSPQFARVVGISDPVVDTSVLAAQAHCDEVRASVLLRHRTALATGGVATVIAGGALVAARRENLDATDVGQTQSQDGGDGYSLPGRSPRVVTLAEPDPNWARRSPSTADGNQQGCDDDKMGDARG